MDIIRYSPCGSGSMEYDDDGRWVEHSEYSAILADNARLREALEHYADARLYFPRGIVLECQSKGVQLAPIYSDFGNTARAALSSQAPEAKGESGETEEIDEDALRAEAEKAFDQYRGKPRSFADICPKYGQGNTALMACGFIDGYTIASRAFLARKPAEEQKP